MNHANFYNTERYSIDRLLTILDMKPWIFFKGVGKARGPQHTPDMHWLMDALCSVACIQVFKVVVVFTILFCLYFGFELVLLWHLFKRCSNGNSCLVWLLKIAAKQAECLHILSRLEQVNSGWCRVTSFWILPQSQSFSERFWWCFSRLYVSTYFIEEVSTSKLTFVLIWSKYVVVIF